MLRQRGDSEAARGQDSEAFPQASPQNKSNFKNRIRATVLYVDHFGNIQLNLKREHLEEADVRPGVRVELELALDRYYAVAARTFADAGPGDIILYEDAYRNVAIAISGGNAGQMFGAREGQDLRIHMNVP